MIGVDARGIVKESSVFQSDDGVELLPSARKDQPLDYLAARFRAYSSVLKAIHWADVVHYHFGEDVLRGSLDLLCAQLLRRPGIIEFWGADIRITEIEAADNEYFAMLGPNYGDGNGGSHHKSRATQQKFSRAGFECVVASAGMCAHVQKDLFSRIHVVRQR